MAAFTLSFGDENAAAGARDNNLGSSHSLQDSFASFREARLAKLQRAEALKKASEKAGKRTQEEKDKLRKKFLDQALSYIGVPYAKRYHEPGSPDYDAPLFLDCCGLVRRAMRDLELEFGFRLGRWNQAYQIDTLPLAVTEADMRPGDLVFISGDYLDTKKKPQRHRMTHVEIWLGDGEKTLGSRWQKGHVEIHDSYRFVSKSYGNMEFHFRSIDTWLDGVCKSCCEEHEWVSSAPTINAEKNSIFSLDAAGGEGEDEGERAEGGDQDPGDEADGGASDAESDSD